jgi:hypothetical protein
VELEISTLADPVTGRLVNARDRLRCLMEGIELADVVGLDVFGAGGHHRSDFAGSAPVLSWLLRSQRNSASPLKQAHRRMAIHDLRRTAASGLAEMGTDWP